MTITATTCRLPVTTTTRATFATSLVHVLERLVGAIAAECRMRRHRRCLMAASDHMLKDIGLARSEVDRAVRFGRID